MQLSCFSEDECESKANAGNSLGHASEPKQGLAQRYISLSSVEDLRRGVADLEELGRVSVVGAVT